VKSNRSVEIRFAMPFSSFVGPVIRGCPNKTVLAQRRARHFAETDLPRFAARRFGIRRRCRPMHEVGARVDRRAAGGAPVSARPWTPPQRR
jgi:hypothetical protein